MNGKNIMTYKLTLFVWAVAFIVQAILGLRFIFRILDANPEAPFSALIYSLSAPLLAPFSIVFDTTVVAGAVVEWSTLLAIIVYGIIAQLIVMMINMGRTAEPHEIDRTSRL
jgi:uncharacterized protein YggT (Ycf19 family)